MRFDTERGCLDPIDSTSFTTIRPQKRKYLMSRFLSRAIFRSPASPFVSSCIPLILVIPSFHLPSSETRSRTYGTVRIFCRDRTRFSTCFALASWVKCQFPIVPDWTRDHSCNAIRSCADNSLNVDWVSRTARKDTKLNARCFAKLSFVKGLRSSHEI